MATARPQIDWKKVHFLLGPLAMSDASIAPFEAEGKWFMAHGTPGAFLIPVPLGGGGPMDLDTAVFLADCMSFDHDSPVVVQPAADNPEAEVAPIEPLFPSTATQDARFYTDLLHLLGSGRL